MTSRFHIIKKLCLTTLVLLPIAGLLACTAKPPNAMTPQAQTPGSSTNLPVGASQTPGSTNGLPPGVLIEYQRNGGFVGFRDHLVISSDRRATLSRKAGRYEFVLDQEMVDRLIQQLDQAEFGKLETKYPPTGICCDVVEYTIIYKEHTVIMLDTDVPEALRPVLLLLDEIVETERP